MKSGATNEYGPGHLRFRNSFGVSLSHWNIFGDVVPHSVQAGFRVGPKASDDPSWRMLRYPTRWSTLWEPSKAGFLELRIDLALRMTLRIFTSIGDFSENNALHSASMACSVVYSQRSTFAIYSSNPAFFHVDLRSRINKMSVTDIIVDYPCTWLFDELSSKFGPLNRDLKLIVEGA